MPLGVGAATSGAVNFATVTALLKSAHKVLSLKAFWTMSSTLKTWGNRRTGFLSVHSEDMPGNDAPHRISAVIRLLRAIFLVHRVA